MCVITGAILQRPHTNHLYFLLHLTICVSGWVVRTNFRNGQMLSFRILSKNAPRTTQSAARFVRRTLGTPACLIEKELHNPTDKILRSMLTIARTKKRWQPKKTFTKRRPMDWQVFQRLQNRASAVHESLAMEIQQDLRRSCGRAKDNIVEYRSTCCTQKQNEESRCNRMGAGCASDAEKFSPCHFM